MASDGMIVLSFFLGILIVLILVSIHELGHFIVAKLAHAYVYEFAIGFGPRLFTWKGKETWVSIRLIPLGGFCSIASEKADPPKGREDEDVPPERMMGFIARWKRLFFIIAGPLMNLFVAIFLFTTIFAATQVKTNDMDWFGAKYSGIAEKLLFESNDQTKGTDSRKYVLMGWEVALPGGENDESSVVFNNVSVNGESVLNDNAKIYDNVNQAIFAKTYSDTVYTFLDHLKDVAPNVNIPTGVDKGQPQNYAIRFAYRTTYNIYSDKLKVNSFAWTKWSTQVKDNDGNSLITYHYGDSVGIAAPTRYFKNSTQAYAYGWKETFSTSLNILKSLGLLITGHIDKFSGPVGMSRQVASMLTSAPTFFLYVAMLSANLFIINILTIPPLDGFKFLETIIEMCIRREIPDKVKIWMYSIGALLFVGVFAAITISDFIG